MLTFHTWLQSSDARCRSHAGFGMLYFVKMASIIIHRIALLEVRFSGSFIYTNPPDSPRSLCCERGKHCSVHVTHKETEAKLSLVLTVSLLSRQLSWILRLQLSVLLRVPSHHPTHGFPAVCPGAGRSTALGLAVLIWAVGVHGVDTHETLAEQRGLRTRECLRLHRH